VTGTPAPPPEVPVRVLVGDDHRAFAEALALRLGAEADLDVVGIGLTGSEVLSLSAQYEPDVVLLDYELGRDDGIDLARRLRDAHPEVRVVVVTCHDSTTVASLAVRAGVAGFVAKDANTEELLGAIRGAVQGETWVSRRLLGGVFANLMGAPASATPEEAAIAQLTSRELEVLKHMMAGYDRATTARALFLSTNTVRTHTRNILAKLGVHSTLEAVALAARAGVRATDAEALPGA
jgi:DNA-binding NarL/FixJ family response regulator